jgi:hypothetical protein
MPDLSRALEAALARLLEARAPEASVCPSEAARAVAPGGWRDLMGDARAAAARMVERGEAEVTQGGRVVDPEAARGPIRVRRPRDPPPPR